MTKPKTAQPRNPYHRISKSPKLIQSVVLWLDMLGYKEMAKAARDQGDSQGFLTRLHSALNECRYWLEDTSFPQLVEEYGQLYALKAFTDNIVIGWPIHDNAEDELYDAITKAGSFQLYMALAGFFVRGAISVGDAYIDDIVVSGPAIAEAGEGEEQLARDPRIILTDSAVSMSHRHIKYYALPNKSPHYDWIYRDFDGQWFLNYLVHTTAYEDGPYFDQILKHKTVVDATLRTHRGRPPIWSKYAWVAAYHNYFCNQYPQCFDDSYKIASDAFQLLPSRIIDEAAIQERIKESSWRNDLNKVAVFPYNNRWEVNYHRWVAKTKRIREWQKLFGTRDEAIDYAKKLSSRKRVDLVIYSENGESEIIPKKNSVEEEQSLQRYLKLRRKPKYRE